jgi:hypothetical protein
MIPAVSGAFLIYYHKDPGPYGTISLLNSAYAAPFALATTVLLFWMQVVTLRLRDGVFEGKGQTLIILSKAAVGGELTKKYYGGRFLRVLHIVNRISPVKPN